MFKWLKKVMISIINAIQRLFVGDKEVQSVTIGDTQVYPDPSVEPVYETIKLVRFASAQYSSGNKLDAAGWSNYAEIIGTVDVYTENVTEGGRTLDYTETVTLIPTATNANWMSIDGTKLYANSRGTLAGNERSTLVDWVLPEGYSFDEEYMTSPQRVSVVQEANAVVNRLPGTISFAVNGGTPATWNSTSGATPSTISVTSSSNDIAQSGTLVCYRTLVYTSGDSEPYTSPIYSLGNWSTGDDMSWATLDTSSTPTRVHINEKTDSGQRSCRLNIADSYFSSTQTTYITITQEGVSNTVLTVDQSKTIKYSTTEFSIYIYSLRNDVCCSTSNGLFINVSNSTIGNLVLSSDEIINSTTGYQKLTFTCDASSGDSQLEATVTISQGGGLTKSITIYQLAKTSQEIALEGISISEQYQNWVVGIVQKSNGTYSTIIAKDSPIESNVTVTLDVEWQCVMAQNSNVYVYIVGSEEITQTISSGSSFNIGNKVYYGDPVRPTTNSTQHVQPQNSSAPETTSSLMVSPLDGFVSITYLRVHSFTVS